MYILISFFVVCRFMHGSRNFRQGSADRKKNTFDNVFIIFYLTLVLNLFSVILSFFLRKTIILKGSSSDRGSSCGPTFSKGGGGGGGGPTFFQGKWGSTLISIETL